MLTNKLKNIEGSFFPEFDRGWGGCGDELFHYTSRYYGYTEAFLRNLSGRWRFRMAGYDPALLSDDQRLLMAAALSSRPERASAMVLVEIISNALSGNSRINPSHWANYLSRIDKLLSATCPASHQPRNNQIPLDVAPLDPFLNIAERLNLPVAVRGHHLELPLHELARHLDSPSPVMRLNLQNAILQLHEAGYLLKNHPGLTHAECLSQ